MGRPEVLYHGTRVGFRKNGWLFPADWHGAAPRPVHADGGTAWVYFTTDYQQARWYAINDRGRGKPKILTLLPTGEIEQDHSEYDGEEDQWCSRSPAKVVGVTILHADVHALRGSLEE